MVATQFPRYETMGVQYADLPRISTAPQQATVESFSRLSQSLDRMMGFVQTELETKAQREAKKYAVENPLTKEQIDTALREGTGLKVAGAGEVFQQTYEQVQGSMLASQLQAEGEAKIGTALAKIKEGAEINLQQTQAELKDMIDGYATAVMVLSPEKSVQLRAALTSSGNTLFQTAAQESFKRDKARLLADVDIQLESVTPLLEQTLARLGTVDPTTGKEIDVNAMIAVQERAFAKIADLDNGARLRVFQGKVAQAKIGAVVNSLTTAPGATPNSALAALDAKAAGNVQRIYDGLAQTDQQKVSDGVMKYFTDRERARKDQDEADKLIRKDMGIDLRQQFYSGKINKNTLIAGLRGLSDITPDELKSIQNFEFDTGKASDQMMYSLQARIARNELTDSDVQGLASKGTISWKQASTLVRDVRDKGSDMGRAVAYVRADLAKQTDPFSVARQRDVARASEVLSELYQAEYSAKQSGKPFDPMAVAQSLVGKRKAQADFKNEESTRNELRDLLTKNGLTYRENWTIEDLKNAGVKDQSIQRAIVNKVKLLEGK